MDLVISSNLEDFDVNFVPSIVYSFDDFSCHEVIIGFDFIDHNNSESLVSKQTRWSMGEKCIWWMVCVLWFWHTKIHYGFVLRKKEC